jgi:hypothetical protein
MHEPRSTIDEQRNVTGRASCPTTSALAPGEKEIEVTARLAKSRCEQRLKSVLAGRAISVRLLIARHKLEHSQQLASYLA